MDDIKNNTGGKGLDESISLGNDDTGDTSISHAPLDLGGGTAIEVPKLEVTEQSVSGVAKAPLEQTVAAERITGVKTFFTKLHAGALAFLDEQITRWLKDNPGAVIKRTNIVTGEIQGKKSEPNLIITIWY